MAAPATMRAFRRGRKVTLVTRNRSSEPSTGSSPDRDALVARHLTVGWWSLLGFVLLGLVLEALHGFKVGWYLEVAYTTRRFSWTLAHAHGTLLAIINIVFAATLHHLPATSLRTLRLVSRGLIGATVILPCGFFLGGLFPYEGDPGVAIFLVPVGGGLLAWSVGVIAMECRKPRK